MASCSALVLWARHGQNGANVTRQFSHRRLDLDLTAVGREQAEQLTVRLVARVSQATQSPALFCSPLRRTRQTAQIVAAALGVNIEVLDELRELNVGDLDGRNDREAWRIYESVLKDWRKGQYDRHFPGGEDSYELRARTSAALGKIATRTRGGTAVVVAHAGNLRAALPVLADAPDPGSDLPTGQFAVLRVAMADARARVQLLAWPRVEA